LTGVVSTDFFDVLVVTPILGGTFRPEVTSHLGVRFRTSGGLS